MSVVVMFVVVVVVSAAAGVPGGRRPISRRPHHDVVTTQGAVRGYMARSKPPAPPHYEYFGIPYGAPPTHADRLKAPKMAGRWDGIFEARHHVRCPQPDGSGEENCLVVNVFAPRDAAMAPVLVYFHQGGFHSGWGSQEPPVRLLRQGFVVVTFNYRLGVLGFLCLGAEDAPGNMGLKDQVAALYWIHRNIDKFGGNAADVTLYGVGAGAASIQFLLLTTSKRGLYHRAIMESGSALSPFSLMEDPVQRAREIAQYLGYSNFETDVTYLARFYRTIDAQILANYSTYFKPCIEKETIYKTILDEDPISILKSTVNEDIPLMFVFTDQEVVSMIGGIPTNWLRKPNAMEFKDLLPSNLWFNSDKLRYNIADSVINLYFKDDNYLKGYLDYFTDTYIAYPVAKSASLHSMRSTQPVFLMLFSFDGNINGNQVLPIDGASHGDVFRHIFSKEDTLDVFGEEVTAKLIALWTNFAKYGDPTPITSALLPTVWPRVLDLNKEDTWTFALNQYLELRPDRTMRRKSMSLRLQFWDKIYINYYKTHEQD